MYCDECLNRAELHHYRDDICLCRPCLDKAERDDWIASMSEEEYAVYKFSGTAELIIAALTTRKVA